MAIEIEKGVPRPDLAGRSGQTKYPFRDMKPGDSFVVRLAETKSKTTLSLQNSLFNCAKNAIGRGKISVRKLPEGDGFRVWRIAA